MPWLCGVGGVDSVDRVLLAITLVYVLSQENASLPCCCQHAQHAAFSAAAGVLRLHAMQGNDAAVCQSTSCCYREPWELLMGRIGLQAHVHVSCALHALQTCHSSECCRQGGHTLT